MDKKRLGNMPMLDDEYEKKQDNIYELLSKRQSRLEQILTDARIPEIMNCIERGKNENGNKTIIFTGYVTGIVDKLARAVSKAGYTYALYTGSLEEPDRSRELDRFSSGDAQVLIASKPIAQGIDGLQEVCNNLIINTLPWTNAEYQQLVGRLVRSGQIKNTVNVHIIKARINGRPYDEFVKWIRILHKRSLADCAVDGIMPIKNLATPAKAGKELEVWYARLNRGDVSKIERKSLHEKLTPAEIEQRRIVFGDFSQMNKQINKEKSETTHKRIQENPDYLIEYHRQWRDKKMNELKTWQIDHLQIVREMIKGLPIPSRFIDKLKIGDFGCGEAELSSLIKQNKVFSFDHHNILNEKIIACDMKQTSLKDGELDVAVFSLSLMGINWIEYIKEARRCLIDDGYLIIVETTRSLSVRGSLYSDEEGRLHELRDVLKRERFQVKSDEQRGNLTFILASKLP